MSSDRFVQRFLTISVVMVVGLYLAGLLIAKPNNNRVQRIVGAATFSTHLKGDENESPAYHVWLKFGEDRRGFTIVVVSVNPRHFNRVDMTKVAMRLNSEFAANKKLKVGLLDDDNIARLYATGRAEYSTYETAERGRYHLDRTACREYIEFSSKKGKPRETIRIKCTRQQ